MSRCEEQEQLSGMKEQLTFTLTVPAAELCFSPFTCDLRTQDCVPLIPQQCHLSHPAVKLALPASSAPACCSSHLSGKTPYGARGKGCLL